MSPSFGAENQPGNLLGLLLLSAVLSLANGGLEPCKSTLAETSLSIRVADRRINSTFNGAPMTSVEDERSLEDESIRDFSVLDAELVDPSTLPKERY
ncbi:hypothetical protein COLO4_07601 [Corchorus olitorius]|uniref:Uncharacterized protein n=1 Tax=Corchorus olitorius TaxID=93759 RepID=A0A1R3KJB4_9ROSI|nr:hypothetical protein COLO4_07601 [Corchorus olitorius]